MKCDLLDQSCVRIGLGCLECLSDYDSPQGVHSLLRVTLKYTLMHKGFCNKTTTYSHMHKSNIASSIHFTCPIFFWRNLRLTYIDNINRVHNNKAFIRKISPICLSQNH